MHYKQLSAWQLDNAGPGSDGILRPNASKSYEPSDDDLQIGDTFEHRGNTWVVFELGAFGHAHCQRKRKGA